MKTKLILIIIVIFSANCFSQIYKYSKIITYVPSSVSEDPYNPNWDWENGDITQDGVSRYWIYLQNRPNASVEYTIETPWHQSGAWEGLIDRKREDGWVLLSRDFGTPTRRLTDNKNPYFVLYNKYRSIIRVFIYLKNMSDIYTYSTMEMTQFQNGKSNGVLSHLASICYASDKIEKSTTNSISAIIKPLAIRERWIYADFPLSFDDVIKPLENSFSPPSLEFKVFGTDVNDITLETKGFAAQGNKNFIESFMKANNFDATGFSLKDGILPNINLDFKLNNLDIKATAPDWGNLIFKFIGNIAINLALPELSIGSVFKDFISGFNTDLSILSNSLPMEISNMKLNGLFDFFVGGGMKRENVIQTAPTFISSHYSSTGTMTKKVQYATLTIPIPNSRLNYNSPMLGNEVGLVQNDPVGLITLQKTPKLKGRIFYKRMYLYGGSYVDQPFYEYEVEDELKYVVNPSSDLELKKIEAYLITNFNAYIDDRGEILTKMVESNNQSFQIKFESPINKSSIKINSMPVPAKYFKGRKLCVGINQKDVNVKIKAIFQSKNDASAQPVVFIATYLADKPTDFSIYDYGYYQHVPLPTIPPQNPIYSFPASGGVKISWDMNLENNIKYYSVERSINGGSFNVIGTTTGTDFTDIEIQKAVKTYSAFSKNVNVNYRIRAMSEWFDENNIMRQQFSGYSDVLYVYGSMQFGPLDKRQNSPIIPESNSLSQNFPNPFNPSTTIYYAVKDEGNVNITVYNSLGQEISTLVNDRKQAGYHYVEWNAAGYPSGVYFYRISNGDYVETKRMVLMK